MSLTEQINNDIKQAMLARDKEKLEALRAIKSALLLEMTKDGSGEVSEDASMKILMKMQKQRLESAAIYEEQQRPELAQVEKAQAEVIGAYLPKQMSEAEVEAEVQKAIASTGASTPKDMGKVMGILSKSLAGKADGKMISEVVKRLLV
jgi:uncharacterized protein YqeY